jgi:hypothetical protein
MLGEATSGPPPLETGAQEEPDKETCNESTPNETADSSTGNGARAELRT